MSANETMNDSPTASPARLDALRASGLLDSPADPALDRLTKLVCVALRVPVALISLVDQDRQFFKSQCGLPVSLAASRETPLSYSFCQHVVNSAEPLLVSNAVEHPVLKDNLAVPDLGVIAYAGVPLTDEQGHVLGSLCAIDAKPRRWMDEDVELLQTLASQVMVEIRLRAESRRLADCLLELQDVDAERRAMTRLTVHDLRTPLTGLLMGLELLPRLGTFGAPQHSALDICRRNGKALQNMIDDVLDIGAADHRGGLSLSRGTCDARSMIEAAIEQVQPIAAAKSIELKFDAAAGAHVADLPCVHADADKLVRVLVNLLANAVKFTPAGGRVGVTARRAVEGGNNDDDGGGEPREFLAFAVEDTGIGIAVGERIFDEGVRLDRSAVTRRSTGLGLTFCQRIVVAHGGRIWFDSVVGQGSTFHFLIPIGQPA